MSRNARLLQSECRGSDQEMSIRRHLCTHVRVHSSRAVTQTRTITEGLCIYSCIGLHSPDQKIP